MPLMRRRPLLRAAAVGGGAYVAGRHRAQSQQREADQDARLSGLEDRSSMPPAAPAASTGISSDAIDRLTQLGQLHDQGVLTDEEFAAQKAKVLGR